MKFTLYRSDADYRKRIIDAVFEFRERQVTDVSPNDPSRF